ncbi:4'-phosphopantetheinyl transferase family protein [Streptomyces sp. NPDC054863]
MTDRSGRLAVTGAVHIWHGRTSDRGDEADLALLNDEELLLVRGRSAPLGAHYAGAHAALRRILADHYLGGPPGAIRFGRRSRPRCADVTHGRPRVLAPATGLEFSLSRSGPHWAVAVTAGGPLGVDIESGHGFDIEGVPDLVLSADELAGLRAAPDEDGRRGIFFRAWTRKEATLKAVGVGIVAELRSLDVRPAQPGPVFVDHAEPGVRALAGRGSVPGGGAHRRTGPARRQHRTRGAAPTGRSWRGPGRGAVRGAGHRRRGCGRRMTPERCAGFVVSEMHRATAVLGSG